LSNVPSTLESFGSQSLAFPEVRQSGIVNGNGGNYRPNVEVHAPGSSNGPYIVQPFYHQQPNGNSGQPNNGPNGGFQHSPLQQRYQ
jgi:hypothetical protein